MSNPRQGSSGMANYAQHRLQQPGGFENPNQKYQPVPRSRMHFPQQPTPSQQNNYSRMRTNSDHSNGGQNGGSRPVQQASHQQWESENEINNQARIKLQKNSKTIYNHRQHIQGNRDRTHSGEAPQTQVQSQQYGNSQNLNMDRQIIAQQQYQIRSNQNYSTNNREPLSSNQVESKNVLSETTLLRNNSQNMQQRDYKPNTQSQLEQLFVQKGQYEAKQPHNSESQCEPFEIKQEIQQPYNSNCQQQSPYFFQNKINSNQGPNNDEEGVVGLIGDQDTSTFGYQQQNQAKGHVQYRQEPLKNEETMGITNQVQQMIEQRELVDAQHRQDKFQNQLQGGLQKENNLNQDNRPQFNISKAKQPNTAVTKLNINQIVKSPSTILNQINQKNTSRNTNKIKQILTQNKSVILKSQKSKNEFKPVLSTSTRNNQIGKEGVVSVKKIKIKVPDGAINPKSSRRSNVNAASFSNLNQCSKSTLSQPRLFQFSYKSKAGKSCGPALIATTWTGRQENQHNTRRLARSTKPQKTSTIKSKIDSKRNLNSTLIKNMSNGNIGTNRNSTSNGASTPTGGRGPIIVSKRRNHESINASRRNSNHKPKQVQERQKNNSPNLNNISSFKRGVDETFVHNLQDSLLKQQYNQPSLMTDSLDGTERKAYMQAQNLKEAPTLNHSLSQRMKFPSPNPSPKAIQIPKVRQKVSLTKREELVNQLAKYIRFDGDSKGIQNDLKSQNNLVRDEIIQENLKKFLQYLEVNQVININEIQRDKAQMNNLVQDIMKIDFDQLQNPDFMNDKLDQISQMQIKKTQNVRSASGASHSSQYRVSAKQGYGSTSGNDTSNYRSNSNNLDSKNQYNTSGSIILNGNKVPTTKDTVQKNRSGSGTEQQYFSASQTSNSQKSPFIIAKHVKPQIESTTATSGVDAKGNIRYQNNVSQESLRKTTSSMQNQSRYSNTNKNLQTSQASNQYHVKKLDVRISGVSGVVSNNSQTRLHTSSSQKSNKYNTSGDQVKILNTSGATNIQKTQNSGSIRQQAQESNTTQISQISNQANQQTKYNNFFQQGKIQSQNEAPQPIGQPQIHNTTINLQINSNVDSVNINKQSQEQALHQQIQNRIAQDKNRGPKIQMQQAQQNRQTSNVSQTKALNQSKVVASNSSLFVNNLGVAIKQKRGGSHEEQTRDRMKQLLQDGSKHNMESSRAATASTNQKAFGASQNKQSQQNGTQKRVHSASTLTKTRSRSIHQKQEHLEGSQKQKLNDEIMMERDKIIKFNKQYMRKYHKFPPTVLDYYKFVKKIGKGAFGEVYLAIHKLTGKYVAIKMIELSQLKDKYSKKKVFQEVYILKKIRHSNIIRLYEVFENKKHIMMVMEYAGGGDLYHLVKTSGHLTEDETKYIFKNIAQGVAHCHCRSVLHRDIKLDNILLDGEGGVKICDFGVSRLVTLNEMIQEQCGTPAYLAPEMSCNSKYHGFYVDIWSLGILLYVMLQGTVPFKASTMENLYESQLQMNIQFPINISLEAENLIKRMLVIKPEDRISFPELFIHPWLHNIIGPDGLPLEGQGDEHDMHDFQMSLSFQRQECNLNPLSVKVSNKNGDITNRCRNEINGEANIEKQIHNINVINVENMFYNKDSNKCKLQYSTYCAVTQDFNTYRIDEDIIRVLEEFGFPRETVITSLNSGELNHATCCYNLLVMN